MAQLLILAATVIVAIALVVALALTRSEAPSPSGGTGVPTSTADPNTLGKSTIGHGGPAPAETPANQGIRMKSASTAAPVPSSTRESQ